MGNTTKSTNLFAPILLAVLAFFAYRATAAPGAWWGDGLELTCAAKTLGIPHPTGYPLYMLLGYAVIQLTAPYAEAGRALTLFSALLCAASVGLAAWMVRRVWGSGSPFLFGGMIFAVARTVWDHATFAEVYPLTLVLVVAMVGICASENEGKSELSKKQVIALAVLWGLAMLNHYSAILIFPLVALSLGTARQTGFQCGSRSPTDEESSLRTATPTLKDSLLFQRLGIFLLVSSSFLIGYAYLPIRAAANPPINWGDPSSFSAMLEHMLGGQFGSVFLASGESFIGGATSGLFVWFCWWGEQWLPLDRGWDAFFAGAGVASGAFYGCATLATRRPAFGWGLLASLVGSACVAALYRIPDIDSFFLPAIPAALLGWIETWHDLKARVSAKWGPDASGWHRLEFVPPIFLAIFATDLHSDGRINKSWDDGPHEWAQRVLKALPKDAVILTRQGGDAEIYSLWYEQIVRGERPDVTVFGTGFLFKGWYRRYFERADRPQLPLFIEERPPQTKDIWDVALIGGVIMPNIKQRRFFTTYVDPTLSQYLNPIPVTQLMENSYYAKSAYKLNPAGPLLFELRAEEGLFELSRKRFIETFHRQPPSAETRN